MAVGSFNSTGPVIGAVVFVPNEFTAIYSEFATVAVPQLQGSFALATMILSNGQGSRVQDATKRQTLLYLLVAHLQALAAKGSDGMVGRINDATEGTVNAHADWSTHVSASQAWFIQTPYGATFWQATAVLRTMRYVPRQC
jgi:hypothetical protein